MRTEETEEEGLLGFLERYSRLEQRGDEISEDTEGSRKSYLGVKSDSKLPGCPRLRMIAVGITVRRGTKGVVRLGSPECTRHKRGMRRTDPIEVEKELPDKFTVNPVSRLGFTIMYEGHEYQVSPLSVVYVFAYFPI